MLSLMVRALLFGFMLMSLGCVGGGDDGPRSCSLDSECFDGELCDPRKKTCRSAADVMCYNSEECLESGKCSALGGECEVGSDWDCEQSRLCGRMGRCRQSGSSCVATNEGCAESDACAAEGLCGLSSDGSACALTTEGCAQLPACAEEGLCGLSSDGSACALTAEGCAQLPACAAEGLCGLSSNGSACVDLSVDRRALEWVRIEGGSFMMGSIETERTTPVHSVTVTPFEITATEVTVAQYRACVDDGRCSEPDTREGCNWNVEGREDHPINCVDWGQARTFAKWIGADVDLPTEAEWEYAARGGQNFIYAGSNNPDEVAWYYQNSRDSTELVRSRQANGYGLYDMSGNVREWVLDEVHENYEGAPTVSDEAWGEVPECGQVCDIGSVGRVNRGGSWRSYADLLRVADRGLSSPDLRDIILGFRLRRTR